MSRKKMQKELFEATELVRIEENYRQQTGKDPEVSISGPATGILPFRLETAPDASQVTGRAGLSLAAEAMRAYRVDDLVREQNLVVADEFRDGNVPAGKDNLALIQRAFRALPSWVDDYRFRSDTACYEHKVLKWLANEQRPGGPSGKIGFAIGADMGEDLQKACKTVREGDAPGDPDHPRWAMLDDTRAHETVEWSEVEFTTGDWPKGSQPLRYLVIRIQKRQGHLFSDGSTVRHLAVVTNRDGQGPDLIRWYWKKAGTIEHVHDETKNALGAGMMPCEEFGANAAWYRLSTVAYNVATLVRRHALPPEEQSARVKRLRYLIFNTVATLTSHARSLIARVSESMLRRVGWCPARREFVARRRVLALASAL